MGMETGEEGGVGAGADRRGQEQEDQAARIIETLRKLNFVELGKKLPNDEIQRSFANAISDLAGGLEELYGVVNILTEMVTEESIRRQQQQPPS